MFGRSIRNIMGSSDVTGKAEKSLIAGIWDEVPVALPCRGDRDQSEPCVAGSWRLGNSGDSHYVRSIGTSTQKAIQVESGGLESIQMTYLLLRKDLAGDTWRCLITAFITRG